MTRVSVAAVSLFLVTSPAASATRPAIVGAAPAERRALVGLMQQMGPSEIQLIRVTSTPRPGQKPLEPRTVRMNVDAGTSMEGHWQADLVIRRYVALAARRGSRLRQVSGFHPHRSTSPASPMRLDLSLVEALARHAGVRVVEARPLLGVAVAVVLRADDPAGFLVGYGRQLVAAIRTPQPHAASFFAIEDARGEVVYETGSLSGLGFFWAKPDLVACGPVVTFGQSRATERCRR